MVGRFIALWNGNKSITVIWVSGLGEVNKTQMHCCSIYTPLLFQWSALSTRSDLLFHDPSETHIVIQGTITVYNLSRSMKVGTFPGMLKNTIPCSHTIFLSFFLWSGISMEFFHCGTWFIFQTSLNSSHNQSIITPSTLQQMAAITLTQFSSHRHMCTHTETHTHVHGLRCVMGGVLYQYT